MKIFYSFSLYIVREHTVNLLHVFFSSVFTKSYCIVKLLKLHFIFTVYFFWKVMCYVTFTLLFKYEQGLIVFKYKKLYL